MNAIHHLRLISVIEGLSYLALLFVAMPLKYALGLPAAVRATGSIHGLLFLIFGALWIRAALDHPAQRALFVRTAVASLVPFGFLLIDKRLRAAADEVAP